MRHAMDFGRVSALPPLALLEAALPRLTRAELEGVIGLLIDRIDQQDGDPDLEDDDDDHAVDDYGCDESDQGDLEHDEARLAPTPLFGADQRIVLHRSRFGMTEVYRHD